MLEEGFRTLKVKVGFDPEQDARRVGLIQKIVAGRCLSAHRRQPGLRPGTGLRLRRRARPRGHRAVRAAVRRRRLGRARWRWPPCRAVPMMLDESIYGMEDIERAARLGAARFIKLKLMKMGSLESLARGIRRIRELGMEPVLGNGVACEVGCWMEACVARTLITNAGEMNGFLKPVTRLLADPLRFADGALVLDAGYAPRLDPHAVSALHRGPGRVSLTARGRGHPCAREDPGHRRHRLRHAHRRQSHPVDGAGEGRLQGGRAGRADARRRTSSRRRSRPTPTPSWCRRCTARASSTAAAFAICASRPGSSDILIYVGGNLVVGKQTWERGRAALPRHGLRPRFPARHRAPTT